MDAPLAPELLRRMDAYWRAANYVSVGQIYLYANPLLREPLQPEHIKPRLLGHWGTTPGQNFIYAHLNRIIRQFDLDMIYLSGPGHGGPAIVGNTYLEGTYSEFYPDITQDAEGLERLFRQFSFPGGIPSHVAPETPGSIHEGGELGYSLSHAYGAVFDNPGLIAACVVGDGEAETGPLAAGWQGNKFLNPATDGAVLPILHLNGYKIANPTLLARIPGAELEDLLRGYGYTPYMVEGEEPAAMHQLMAGTLDRVVAQIQGIQRQARSEGFRERPRWPMVVLRTPKGWTGPKKVDGQPVEGTFRAHQVPLAEVRTNPVHLELLEEWLRSYRPDELFDAGGTLRAELAELAPRGERRMGANPQANGGLRLRDLHMPDFREYAVPVAAPDPVAASARVAELSVELTRLETGPQRLHAPGPGVHRSRRQQESRRDPRLSAAGRQLSAVGGRSLPAQPALRKCRRSGQAPGSAVVEHGRGHQALQRRHRHLGMGEQRPRAGARRGHGLRRGRAHARDARRGQADAWLFPRAQGAGRQRDRPDEAAAAERAPARPAGRGFRRPVHARPSDHLRLPRIPVAHPSPDLPAHQSRQPARPGLQGGRHDHHALRHDGPERPRSLSPGRRCRRQVAAAGVAGRLRQAGPARQADRASRIHRPPRRGPSGNSRVALGKLRSAGTGGD